MNNKDKWDTSQFKNSKIIGQLKPLTDLFKSYKCWPSLSNYEKTFKQFKMDIKPVPQSLNADDFESQYEPRVYLKNELQTRIHNWHDFFNALIWLKFKKTKKMLNALHYNQAILRDKGTNRSVLENRITQFDECGAVIISNDNNLLTLIENHQWNDLFIKHRGQFGLNLECVIFGHAIFEKALNPYIGMTCHCILLQNESILNDIKKGNYGTLDTYLSELWVNKISLHPDTLHPFPVLGIPDYWEPQNPAFYENRNYFR